VTAIVVLAGPRLAVGWVLTALALRAAVEAPLPRALRTVAVGALLAGMIAAPVLAIPWLLQQGGHVLELTAFATNMALLRVWAYAVDRANGTMPAPPLGRYLVAMLFFPTFVNGPIEPARRLADPWPTPTTHDLWEGLRRIAIGCLLMLAIGVAFPPGWTARLADAPRAGAMQLWTWGGLLYLWFLLSFSAWSDVAIGLGRICGRRVEENFARPWQAVGVADFWHRWHISLGHWLRDYVYVPLGGGRRWRARNVLVVFAVSAAWHVWGALKVLGFGYYPPIAWSGFACWGLLHGLGVAYGPRPRSDRAGAWRLATFAFAAWAWIPFFLPASVPPLAGARVLLRMLWPWG
jgi:hypothetical protein